MESLELVGYTADLTHLVISRVDGSRGRLPVSAQLLATLAEMIELGSEIDGLDRLGYALGRGNVPLPPPPGPDPDAASPAAALLTAGALRPRAAHAPDPDGSVSRLTPSEIQRLLRAGKPASVVAEQAGTSLEWVQRWERPIKAEQRKVIASVLGGRQERNGFGLSRDLIGDAVRANLMARDVEPDAEEVEWSALRPEGRPYWTVQLKFTERERPQRATWRYDIGTGRAEPRDDLALDLGWTHPVQHPTPGKAHPPAPPGSPEGPPLPPRRSAPPPPPSRRPARWDPPAPPTRTRRA